MAHAGPALHAARVFALGGVLAVVLSQAGCTTARTEWWPAEATPLRLSDGMPFAWVQSSSCLGAVGPSAQARFAPDGSVAMSVQQYGVSLEGVLWDPQVFVEAPLEFGWGVVSAPSTPLQVRRVMNGEVELVPSPRTDLIVAGAWTPRRVACGSLRWEGWREVDGVTFSLDQMVVVAQRRDGPRAATIPAGTPVRAATAGSSRGTVEVELRDGTRVQGWTWAPVPEMHSGSGTMHCICCRGVRPRSTHCDEVLHLFASNGARTEPVGTLDAQVAFVPGDADGGWQPIEPDRSFFRMSKGWALVVASEEFEACHPKVLQKPEGHLAAPTHLADE